MSSFRIPNPFKNFSAGLKDFRNSFTKEYNKEDARKEAQRQKRMDGIYQDSDGIDYAILEGRPYYHDKQNDSWQPTQFATAEDQRRTTTTTLSTSATINR